jgi:hypothetical protein
MPPGKFVNITIIQGPGGAYIDTHGLQALIYTGLAEFTFMNLFGLLLILRNLVGTCPGAVFAPNTSLLTVLHNTVTPCLLVGLHRTSSYTCRLFTVVTGKRHKYPGGIRKGTSYRQGIVLLTGGLTCTAANALLHIHKETQLMPSAPLGRLKT